MVWKKWKTVLLWNKETNAERRGCVQAQLHKGTDVHKHEGMQVGRCGGTETERDGSMESCSDEGAESQTQ